MKNTKKLLTVICAAVVLFATVFAIASAAVVAGEETTVTEYAKMKITASYGFEDGVFAGLLHGYSNGGLTNDAKHLKNFMVYTRNNGARDAVNSIYGDETSNKYFIFDYNTNTSGKHWYIQTKLGVLDNPEKTPVNGFIAEFDIAFLSPVEILQEQARDENDELMWETEDKIDSDGNPVTVYKQATDENGELLWETNKDGSFKLDENGEKIPQKIPVMQNAQEPLYTDELKIIDGEQVYKVTGEEAAARDINGKIMEEKDSSDQWMTLYVQLYEQATDASGSPLWEKVDSVKLHDSGARYVEMTDENSGKTYLQLVDAKDNLLFMQKTDASGNLLWVDGAKTVPQLAPISDENDVEGKTVWSPKKVPEYMEVLDENGEVVMTDKVVVKEWNGMTKSFEIEMYNTHTYVNGSVKLLSFVNNENTETKVKTMKLGDIKGNLLANPPKVHLSPDEWCHITVHYDAKSLLTYIYLGREDSKFDTNEDGVIDHEGRLLVGYTRSTATLDTGEVVDVYPLQFRMGSTSTSGVVGFDNFLGYQGTTIHDPTLLNGKLPYEKYLYLADILANGHEYETKTDAYGNVVYRTLADGSDLLDTLGNKVPEYVLDEAGKKNVVKANNSAVNRYDAFNLLALEAELRKVYTGEDYGGEPTEEELLALEAAFALYDLYSADKRDNTGSTETLVSAYYEMVKDAMFENAATYLSYAEDAERTARTLDNYQDRAAKVVKASEFYNSVGSLMQRDNNGDYGKAVKLLEKLEIVVKQDEAAYNFINAMSIFKNSVAYGSSAARIKTHYENATYYYEQFAEVHDYKSPDTKLDADSVQKIVDAVEYYVACATMVDGNIKESNSLRFVGIVDMMQKRSVGSWDQDGESVRELWLRALDILLSGEYDESLESFQTAKVMFDSANKHFWSQLQKEHLKVITDKLDSYNSSDMTYIDKAGICTYVDRYIQANEKYLDLESLDLTREISRNEAYKVQLNTLVGDYRKLLVENAPRFISVMKMTKHFSTYADLKPMYDEATKYYYAMNIEGDGIEQCLEDYEALRSLITSIERDSQAYIDVINGNVLDEEGNAIYKPMSEITDQKELYLSLKEAYLCFEGLDITYPGAAEAKEMYDEKYEEYTAGAAVINTELAASESIVYATRGNWTFKTVVAFVKKLINTKG